MAFGRTRTLRTRPDPLFGETVELKIVGASRRRCANADRTIRAQLDRLGSVLDQDDPFPAERTAVASVAGEWSERTLGAFDATKEVNLQAFALGWIIDQTVDRVRQLRPAIESITVAVGSDVIHAGSGSAIARLDAAVRVPLSNQAISTASAASCTASVITESAASAAVLARVLLAGGPQASDSLSGLGADTWMITDDGTTTVGPNWPVQPT